MIIRKSGRGFTLVEVIVVSVIVAILAAVAIPIYTGYVRDSTVNMCSSTAADLAVVVSMGISSGATGISPSFPGDIAGPATITWTMPQSFRDAGGANSNSNPTFNVPPGITITTTGIGTSVGGTILAWKTGKPDIKGTVANY